MKRHRIAWACMASLALSGCVSVEHERNPDLYVLAEQLPHAEKGDASAQYRLGDALAGGGWNHVTPVDTEASLRYLLAAAEQDDVNAQLAVARVYLRGGNDSTADRAESVLAGKYWLLRAAGHGVWDAYDALASWNTAHRQPAMNTAEACKWAFLAWKKCTDPTLTPAQIEAAHAEADAWVARVLTKQ